MQNLGTLDHFNILSMKRNESLRLFYEAQNNQNNDINIIEIINNNHANNNNNPNNNNFPAKEIEILNQLNKANCPYILRYIGNGNGQLILNNQNPKNEDYLIYENAQRLTLFDYIKVGRLTEKIAKLLFKKILSGFQVIHKNNFCHRDIKAENILFDNNYNPKIFGFYFSCINSNILRERLGTPKYMTPEIIKDRPYDGFKADIFSLGQLLFFMVTGMFGFNSAEKNDKNYSLIMLKHIKTYWNLKQFHDSNISDEFKDLYVKMVSYNPNERPNIEEILKHPWMEEIINSNQDELNLLEEELRAELLKREEKIQML